MESMHSEMQRLTASEAVRHLKAREFTAVEYMSACAAQIEALEGTLDAWAHLALDGALETAAARDRSLAAGEQAGPLHGVPVGIKDIMNTTDMPTQMGSPIWSQFTPGNDARVVYYLRQSGAIIPGKTVTAEFAVHTPGPTRNPHALEHMAGTSSTGSAVAVASYMVPLAIGTQTAGSIIRPASYCGVYGFKPSFGLVPRTGMLKTTDSLDTVGWFARSVQDVALAFETMRVHGADYPVSEHALNRSENRLVRGRPWRVAVVRGPKWRDAEGYAQQALLEFAQRLGHEEGIEVSELDLPPSFAEAHEIHAEIYDRTLAYYFKKEYESRTLISHTMYDIIRRGNEITVDEYKHALTRQRSLSAELGDFFRTHDVILTLSTGGEALEGRESVDRPDNCLIWTLCGAPALSLPIFTGPGGLPFGAQLVARRHGDYLLLAFARLLATRGFVTAAPHPIPAVVGRALESSSAR
jgi:Asp-tRNA(Asn)/Glu-tRNA(Gln) amidotransferase A subunit family amidase